MAATDEQEKLGQGVGVDEPRPTSPQRMRPLLAVPLQVSPRGWDRRGRRCRSRGERTSAAKGKRVPIRGDAAAGAGQDARRLAKDG